MNVVFDPDVRGTVTVNLQDVPWDQALEMILKQNKMGKTIEGNILRIAPVSRPDPRGGGTAASSRRARSSPGRSWSRRSRCPTPRPRTSPPSFSSKISEPRRDHRRRPDQHPAHLRGPRQARAPREAHHRRRHADAPGLDRGPRRRGLGHLRPQPGRPVGLPGRGQPVLRQRDQPAVPQQRPRRRRHDPRRAS
ncbi:MAG: secretin and TonB N-terminal domain-containing protein [Desulfomicrobium escambiense]|nr:secretin and TonB N-terminal domain-containing protein [Desulfomicrobium escambiense]